MRCYCNSTINRNGSAVLHTACAVSAAYEMGNSVYASLCLRSYCIVATVNQKGQSFEKVKSNFKAPWD
jgi:hypothetical protein